MDAISLVKVLPGTVSLTGPRIAAPTTSSPRVRRPAGECGFFNTLAPDLQVGRFY